MEQNLKKGTGGVAQVEEHLPSKHEAKFKHHYCLKKKKKKKTTKKKTLQVSFRQSLIQSEHIMNSSKF
jgi:hypothetical protein